MSAIPLSAPPSTLPPTPSLPGPARITVEEFLERYNGGSFELVQGVVQEIPMAGLEHGGICLRIGSLILAHVDANDLGRVMSNDSFVRVGEKTLRGADVLFYSYERLPREQPAPAGSHTQAPDLVVEVKSPSDRWVDLLGKVVEYIKAGVRVVVLVDPGKRTVSVYRDEEQTVLHEGDELTLPDVLPGFRIAIARLFA